MSANNHKKEIKKQEVAQEKATAEANIQTPEAESQEMKVGEAESQEMDSAEPEVQEIQEFVVSSEETRSERKKAEQASINALAGLSGGQKGAVAVIFFAAIAFAYIMIGIRVCGIDSAVVCALLVIQVVIGWLLDHSPVWLHICVAAADLIVGFCLNQALLMAASMVVYVAAIVALEVLQRTGRSKKA